MRRTLISGEDIAWGYHGKIPSRGPRLFEASGLKFTKQLWSSSQTIGVPLVTGYNENNSRRAAMPSVMSLTSSDELLISNSNHVFNSTAVLPPTICSSSPIPSSGLPAFNFDLLLLM